LPNRLGNFDRKYMVSSKGVGRTFVMGDIHGAYRALRQCLERSEFDVRRDHLICLGDVCDGWPDTKMCIDELLKIQKLTYVIGNHDLCALQWMTSGEGHLAWRSGQGGEATIRSYRDGLPSRHIAFLSEARPYSLLENKLFVHAGIDPQKVLEEQTIDTFVWDRTLAQTALNHYLQNISAQLTVYDEVYIGHTPVHSSHPIFSSGVWLMDTGAGWTGVLSIMDINTKDVFTSDPVPVLYPDDTGRSASHC